MKAFVLHIALITLALTASAQESATPLTDAIQRRDPAVRNKLYYSSNLPPLCLAAEAGHADMVRRLLAENAEVNRSRDVKTTALCCAVWGRNLECVQLLVEAGADIHSAKSWGKILSSAIHTRRADIVGYLLSKTNTRAEGSLQRAATYGTPEICKLLLDAGYTLEGADSLGNPPLCSAVAYHGATADTVRIFLAAGADVHQANTRNGMTPLHLAAWYHGGEKEEILSMLLEAGADMEARDAEGNTPLMLAVRYRNYPAAKFLLEHGADTTVTDRYGTTLLMKAVLGGSLPVTALLLDAGADVNAVNIHGRTALMLAARQAGERGDIVGLLIKHGADPDLQDKEGKTALIYAAEADDYDLGPLLVLLAAGADTEIATPAGKTAADLLSVRKRQSAAGLIESYRNPHPRQLGVEGERKTLQPEREGP